MTFKKTKIKSTRLMGYLAQYAYIYKLQWTLCTVLSATNGNNRHTCCWWFSGNLWYYFQLQKL